MPLAPHRKRVPYPRRTTCAGSRVKIALVNQPFSVIRLPESGRPLHSGSIGLWTFHVAIRCARSVDTTVYTSSPNAKTSQEPIAERVVFREIPTRFDRHTTRALEKWWRVRAALSHRVSPLFASSWYSKAFGRRVARDLARHPCDVVWLTNFSQLAPPIRAHNPGVKIILHMQCSWLNQLDREMIRRRLSVCDGISGCSEFIAQGVAERFPEFSEKCFALHNGVDLEVFSSAEGPVRHQPPEILFVGRISPEKGVHVLIDAFKRIATKVPGVRLSLIGTPRPAPLEYITGSDDDARVRELKRFYTGGREQYLQSLRAGIPQHLADRIAFLGGRPQAQLAAAYRRATVMVFPSVWHEPFGMTQAEAMACGTPVISTRGGGIPEVIEDGVHGLLVERGNAVELADALLRLLKDEGLRRQLAKNGRQRVVEAFSWDRVADQLLTHSRCLLATT